MATMEQLRVLARKLYQKGADEDLVEGVLCLMDTDEQIQQMCEVLDNSKNPGRTFILGKALLIVDP